MTGQIGDRMEVHRPLQPVIPARGRGNVAGQAFTATETSSEEEPAK